MNTTPIIRDGKLVPGAFADHDLSKLDTETKLALAAVLDKERAGKALNHADLATVAKAHVASARTTPADPLEAFTRAQKILTDMQGKR